MVRLGGDRWKGLCTEWVILNESGWRRKWTWRTGTEETILEARKENCLQGNNIMGGGMP